VIVADGDELPEEVSDELLICRVMVSPPPAEADSVYRDEPIPDSAPAPSPRERTPLVIDRFRLPINYPNRGAV
jgi:hypothetical protein